jgi:hypothetical protein
LLLRRLAVLALVLLLLSATGCDTLVDTPEEQFARDIKTLEASYREGQTTRASLQARGLTADSKSCAEMYAATGASEHSEDTKEFAAKRQAYFSNGCLGLPKPTASTTTTRA